ncbi:MAG TPA: KEOPS complex subunit Pcc1 [Methanocorpusculum sp.]|nr:KEOPS complex subunit Pcc1 [Methanocorpusculum sp.]
MNDDVGILIEMGNKSTHMAKFQFACPYAEKLYAALTPEACSEPREKSWMQISRNEEIVTLFVKAEDATALRASLNMWLRLVNVCKEILEL